VNCYLLQPAKWLSISTSIFFTLSTAFRYIVFSLPLLCGPQNLSTRKHTQGGVSHMTPKQILDSFSATLMQDDRILSAQERELLANLLHHTPIATTQNQETQEAVRSAIASAVGETIAQRAFSVLGASIVERILTNAPLPRNERTNRSSFDSHTEVVAKKASESLSTPGIVPGVPGSPEPVAPGVRAPRRGPMDEPVSPSPEPVAPGVKTPRRPADDPSEPVAPGHDLDRTSAVAQTSVAVLDRPAVLKAQCVIWDEFLAPQELEELIGFALENDENFAASEVVSPNEDHGIVNYEHRRSRVLMDLGHHEERVLEKIKNVLPQVLRKLGMEDFAIARFEAQITASNDGDFFRFHSDNGSERVASRYLTFVYFFHREPRQFEGGELRIHDARLENGAYVSDGNYQTIAARQNQIVFFPCELLHEITPVKCPSRRFADSRFTLNGWLRR
jgi:Rps23 Pro-64 3,4-dihydroxylase Tpa1-like proline 4-hydroxylase